MDCEQPKDAADGLKPWQTPAVIGRQNFRDTEAGSISYYAESAITPFLGNPGAGFS